MNGVPNNEQHPEPNIAVDPVRLEGFEATDLYQRREKIFTRYVGGVFQKLRFWSGWPLLTGYFLLPWLNWGDRQAVLFDLPARQFHILGLTFWPQDFWLLGWLLIIAAFGLFTVTTLVGRLWCGYTCPQTVWTAIFMWMEQITEGSRTQRMRLEKAPWSLGKINKRLCKHGMWLGWAFLTGLTFVGYFTPIRELAVDLVTVNTGAAAGAWITFFTLATYINAGWLREQVCIYMCPYARFQSAMFDKDTLIVSYDATRGEPRGSRKRVPTSSAKDRRLGDCIDCRLCVQVCPTGIDIRDGLQYQCIGCAHCIDACNQVMDKMGYAPDLVRYTTEHELQGGKTRWLRFRAVGYAAALTVMILAFSTAMLTRIPFAVDVLRERGELYQELSSGEIGNQYRLRVLNKSQRPIEFTLRVRSDVPFTVDTHALIVAAPGELLDLPMQLRAPRGATSQASTRLSVEICEAGGNRCVSEETRFLSPTRSAGAVQS